MKRLAAFNVEVDYPQFGNFIEKATPLIAVQLSRCFFRGAVRIAMQAGQIASLSVANRKLERLLKRKWIFYGCHDG
jgi:hypothetical protein